MFLVFRTYSAPDIFFLYPKQSQNQYHYNLIKTRLIIIIPTAISTFFYSFKTSIIYYVRYDGRLHHLTEQWGELFLINLRHYRVKNINTRIEQTFHVY